MFCKVLMVARVPGNTPNTINTLVLTPLSANAAIQGCAGAGAFSKMSELEADKAAEVAA